MEEQETQPSIENEVQPAVSEDVTPENNPSPATSEPQSENVHKQNWNNGKRRIQQKARIKELEERLAKYEGKNDDFSNFQRGQLQDRLDDMRAIDADAEATEFESRAEQWFGNETSQFMEQTYKYAEYVNANEPDLLRYAQREYGLILLYEWYNRMDNPKLRQEWLQMTSYEKGAVLANFYQQITNLVTNYNKKPAPQANVPVPNGGRQTPSTEPSDDFGIEFGRAIARRKG